MECRWSGGADTSAQRRRQHLEPPSVTGHGYPAALHARGAADELDAPKMPPPAETTKVQQPAAAVLPNAPETEKKKDQPPAACVSTLAELGALTKVK